MDPVKKSKGAFRYVRAQMRAAQTWVRGVVGVVRAMDKARADGKDLAGWDTFVDDMLGLNESKYARAVESEAEGMSGRSFSLTPDKMAGSLTHEQRQTIEAHIATGKGAIELSRQAGSYPTEQREALLAYDRSAVAEAALVASGLKPLYHESGLFTEEEQALFVESFKAAFPHLEVEAWGAHVAVWDAKAVQAIIDSDPAHYGTDARAAIHKAAETDEIGELLGNVTRNRQAGEVTVTYRIGGEMIAGGFRTTAAMADEIGNQRREALEMAFGEPVTMEIIGTQSHSLTPVQRLGLVENRLAVVLSQNTEAGRKFAQRANQRLARLRSRYAGVPAVSDEAERRAAQ